MNENIDLSRSYLERAFDEFYDAQLLYNNSRYNSSISRAYYCVFHCINACIYLYGFEFQKHSAVITKFRELFIKTGKFEAILSDIIKDLFEFRNICDYDVGFKADIKQAKICLESAKLFYDKVSDFINSRENL